MFKIFTNFVFQSQKQMEESNKIPLIPVTGESNSDLMPVENSYMFFVVNR